MSNLFSTFKHIFPRAAAWLMPYAGNLRKYIEGLSEYPQDIREESDRVFLDIFPQTTRELERWEKQFDLSGMGTDQQRRDIIDARWKAQGGQGKDYLESVIHAAGFTDVYLHPWWNSDGTTKNPNFWLQSSIIAYEYYTGKPGAQTGDGVTQTSGSRSTSRYIYYTNKTNAQTGDGVTQTAGQIIALVLYPYYTNKPGAQTGDGVTQTSGPLSSPRGFLLVNKGPNISYSVPQTIDEYREILYVGAEVFPNFADVPASQRDEFERLLLKYLPYSHWIGLLINYV